MSLWGVFVIVGSIGIILSLGAAVLRPRDRAAEIDAVRADELPLRRERSVDSDAGLSARVDALEVEVDDLQRAVTQLREENEYLQQRLDTDPSTGEFS